MGRSHYGRSSWPLFGFPESRVRDMLKDRCPQLACPDWEAIWACELGGDVVLYDIDEEEAWMQSAEFVDHADV